MGMAYEVTSRCGLWELVGVAYELRGPGLV